jgi:hypothetical protein
VKRHLLTAAVAVIAGPNAAIKTHEITTQISRARKRRQLERKTGVDWKHYKHKTIIVIN